MSAAACDRCRFYKEPRIPSPRIFAAGQCRRHAPPAHSQDHNDKWVLEATWPRVRGEDWCGDFEPGKSRGAERK